MKFLEQVITEQLKQNPDLSDVTFVLPGKRPVVFIKRILAEQKYSGMMPDFFSVSDLISEISGLNEIDGIALWLYAFEVYQSSGIVPQEDFASFLKWFPTLQKDWDDMLKFAGRDIEVLQYMFDEERIKDWAQNLGEEEVPRRKYLNFWKNMNVFLPLLKQKLQADELATSGMIHEAAKNRIDEFAQKTTRRFVFCGFNAFTPVEEALVRALLQWDKAVSYFQADGYYLNDQRQEAGKFLRSHRSWKEFNDHRPFTWTSNNFVQQKDISIYEVPGNVTQTKILPELLENCRQNDPELTDTAVVLLDENLLPATLDALSEVPYVNITMGFPLKNLGFSNAIKHIFHLQKQLEKRSTTYYYSDILAVLDELPNDEEDLNKIAVFRSVLEERNIVYIPKNLLQEHLSELPYFNLFEKAGSAEKLLKTLVDFCFSLKFTELDDIEYENVSHFERAFRIILNQIQQYRFPVTVETLEVLVSQLINSEAIDFQGEPLRGLQVMGLLETRLLNFRNVIMLSVNEGKLPLGNTQNTYLPFDVRNHFGIHTFLENDSIYAYHFYRLLQEAEHVALAFNSLSSGVNTGEKSRFITQIEIESPHNPNHIVIENNSPPVEQELMVIEKTPSVLAALEEWKNRVSATHLTSYLYNPIDFYLNKVLGTYDAGEIEEELSVRNYGNLVHLMLQSIYEKFIGKTLSENDLKLAITKINEAVDTAVSALKHQPEYYERGINFIHKSIAVKVVESVLRYDLRLIEKGANLKIIALEKNFENVDFPLDETGDNCVKLFGFIDRVDELEGTIRIIDYKTAKTKDLRLKIDESNIDTILQQDAKKQAIQLCIYNYVAEKMPEFSSKPIVNGIWSFAEVNKGVVPLQFTKGEPADALVSIRKLILEILNPEIPFKEKVPYTAE